MCAGIMQILSSCWILHSALLRGLGCFAHFHSVVEQVLALSAAASTDCVVTPQLATPCQSVGRSAQGEALFLSTS
jgi:hypothetical protein